MQHDKIYQLFSNRYNQSTWKEFLGLSFTNTRLLSTPQSLTVDNAIALSVQNLGNIILNEDGIERQIAVFDVTLAKGIILEKNRVGLRNLLRKYWRDIDAAFIVYHLEGMPNWRFTFVSELTGYNDEGEFIKITTEPKRFTYILGEGESTRTAVERFAHLFKKTAQISLNDIKEAFSVEKLSKSFFDAYKKHYDTLCTHLSSEITINNGIFKGDDKAIRDFSKKFLGRIVFLYFIQKKGWLGVPPKEKYGKGDTKFLQNQFDNFRNKDLFYKEFLTILFFETLNKYRNDDIFNYDNQQFLTPHSQVKIPFLSGGLFDEDDVKQRDITIPSNVMRNIFDFFNQYNFTIYEDSPDDHTVAVDPEMLGHIFENLLEDNKDKGAFYTPREIVHYMCQESIIEYLCTTLSVEEDVSKRKAIEELFKLKEVNPILQLELKKINKALDSVKICDPAIGSGAFPMGLLHEIFTAKQTLHLFEYGNTLSFDASAVKQNIIQNSIYGVDIEKGAVDIARLRFWLSLVVDEDEPKALPNLDYKIVHGNSLVSKFDDEIVDIDWNPKGSVGKADEYLNNLKVALDSLSKKQKEYFSAALKADLKAEIRNLKLDILLYQLSFNQALYQNRNQIKLDSGLGLKAAELKSNAIISEQLDKYEQLIKKCLHLKEHPDLPLNFFDWKLDFPEVMNEQVCENVGFDIVIGNPPYIQLQKDGGRLSKDFEDLAFQTFERTGDIYSIFYEKGILLLKHLGFLTFITSNKWMRASYGKSTRNFFAQHNPIKLIDLGSGVFESATVDTNILIIQKADNSKNCYAADLSKVKKIETLNNLTYSKCQFVDAESWTINSDIEQRIKLKIEAKGKPLKDWDINIYRGVLTGYNEAFIIDGKTKDELISKDPKSAEIIKPILRKNSISKYLITFKDEYLLNIHNGLNSKNIPPINIETFKIIKYYIDNVVDSIENGLKERKGGHKLNNNSFSTRTDRGITSYNLRNCAYLDKLDLPKIMWKQTSIEQTFVLDTKGFFTDVSGQFLTINDNTNSEALNYLLAFLNSKFVLYLMNNYSIKFGARGIRWIPAEIEKIPIPQISQNSQKPFIDLVNKVLINKEKGLETTHLENQIDNLVYRLYDLTYEEVKVIDPQFSLTEDEYNAIVLE
jgi:hypothetical protein